MVRPEPVIHACACGGDLDVQWQGRYTKTPDGQWVECGGFYIATCWDQTCALYGDTKEISNHANLVKKLKEAK